MRNFVQKSCVPSSLLHIELQQASDEGKAVAEFEGLSDKIASMPDVQSFEREMQATRLFEILAKSSEVISHPYQEPDEWPGIATFGADTKGRHAGTYEKIYGGILGKCSGCLLGKPVEGWQRKKIVSLLSETHNIPLTKFLYDGLDHSELEKYRLSLEWLNLNSGMPEDDDINYMIVNTELLQNRGVNFSSNDVAEAWTSLLPLQRLCTAERIAYRNFVNGIYPPQSASYCNPYREWIGAAIRADVYGYIAAGKPDLAANLAWKDARISHVKNGIYGAVWLTAKGSSVILRNAIYTVR